MREQLIASGEALSYAEPETEVCPDSGLIKVLCQGSGFRVCASWLRVEGIEFIVWG